MSLMIEFYSVSRYTILCISTSGRDSTFEGEQMENLCAKTTRLSEWILWAKLAGVAFIPARFSRKIPASELYQAEKGESAPILSSALVWFETTKAKYLVNKIPFTVRFDHCSCNSIKKVAGKGQEYSDDPSAWQDIMVDDRVLDIATALDFTRLVIRPYIEPLRYKKYAVEFRVFFGPDGWLGTSSYYPQRRLPWKEFGGLARKATRIAKKLVEVGEFPIGCSLDFLVEAKTNRLLFIEGGPPHIVLGDDSAHPCCFLPGNIKGYALGRRKYVLDEEDN